MYKWLFIWLIMYNSYVLIIALEILTIILVYTIKLNYHIFYYILISSISTLFYIMSFKDNIFIIISIGLKFALWPLNIWLIDIYKRFNNKELLIWSILPKITFMLIFNNYYWLFNNKEFLLWNIISIIAMSIYSYKLTKLNELLAISSIINNSYLYMVIDKELFIIYYIIHLLLISWYVNIRLRNLWYNNLYSYFIFIIWIISIIGIPPLIGFNLKYMILEYYYNNILVILGVILSSIYYISLIIYVNTGTNIIKFTHKISFLSILLL